MSKIRVFIKRPKEDPFLCTIENTDETLKSYVGTEVKKITLCSDFGIVCGAGCEFTDEKFNFSMGKHQFFGTVIFVGLKDDEITHVPCTIASFRSMFKNLYNGGEDK